ncbi:hypothetical protein HYDPIDRAFT_110262 [Hydnomerulius pinastri MD-312]|nr:hypothetical protein HYDPIDRAFT_110262 [Hydnomerulius pinastri MD-312]
MSLFLPPITTKLLADFFLPSLDERVQFKKQLAAFHDEITILQARIVELNSHINVTKHNLSLARVLPLDVLYEIFDRWLVVDRDAPSTAIRVCRSWREGILAYPQAWRRIDIRPIKHCQELVAHKLGRAGDCALDVRLHIYVNLYGWRRLSLEQHHTMEAAFAEMCKASHRWDRLTVFLSADDMQPDTDEARRITSTLQSISGCLAAASKLPLLRVQSTTLICSGWYSWDPEFSWGGHLLVPNSTQKSLVYLGLPLQKGLPSNTLRSITIGKCTYESAEQIISLLSDLPVLQILSMMHVSMKEGPDDQVQRDNPYIHHALTEFNLADFGSSYHDSARLLLGHMLLTLPNLRQLFLSSAYHDTHSWDADEDERDILIGFLERSKAPLEALHLPTYLFNDEWLYRILSLSPQLKSLTIRIHGCSNAPRELLTSFDSTAWVLCPDLEHLTLISCSAEHMDLIHELARTRHQFLEGRSGGESETAGGMTADTQMMLRPFRSLHVYGPPEVIGRAGDIEEMMPAGTLSLSIEHTKRGETPHEIMEQAMHRPEWDPMR